LFFGISTPLNVFVVTVQGRLSVETQSDVADVRRVDFSQMPVNGAPLMPQLLSSLVFH